jgi:hypothetical protein
MKKAPFAVFLLVSLLIGSLASTAIEFLHHVPVILPEGLDLEPLIHGQALQLLTVQAFWSIYPAIPPVNLLFTPLNALILMVIMLAGLGLWSLKRQVNPLVVNTILFFSALVPYAIGWAALLNNDRPENSGWWLAFMLVGVFYASLACAFFSSIQIAKILTSNH